MKLVDFLKQQLNKFKQEFGVPTAVKVVASLRDSKLSIFITNNPYNDVNQIESLDFNTERSITLQNIDELVKFDLHSVRVAIFNSIVDFERSFSLPTTVISYEGERRNDLLHFTEYKLIGLPIVERLRDYPMDILVRYIDYYTNKTLDQIISDIPIDENEENKNKNLATAKMFQSFNESQISFLKDLLLDIVDSSTFNFMSFFDESIAEDQKISLQINGIPAEEIPMFGNGNWSSDYLEWIYRYSKYDDKMKFLTRQ